MKSTTSWLPVLCFFEVLMTCVENAKSQAADSATCTQSCDKATCAQTNFTQCNVLCDNAGVTSIVGTCQSSSFSDQSKVNCTLGACQSAVFTGQTVVDCTGENSCGDITGWDATVTCDEDSCGGAHFYASSISCSGSYSTNSCHDIFFTPCTCCDGGGACPEGIAGCTGNTRGFCSSTYLGRNCQEWGNPACNGLTISKYLVRNSYGCISLRSSYSCKQHFAYQYQRARTLLSVRMANVRMQFSTPPVFCAKTETPRPLVSTPTFRTVS
jgi:hypothetical protein